MKVGTVRMISSLWPPNFGVPMILKKMKLESDMTRNSKKTANKNYARRQCQYHIILHNVSASHLKNPLWLITQSCGFPNGPLILHCRISVGSGKSDWSFTKLNFASAIRIVTFIRDARSKCRGADDTIDKRVCGYRDYFLVLSWAPCSELSLCRR